MNTVNASGFNSIAEYYAYDDYNGNKEITRGEKYIIMTPQTDPSVAPINATTGSKYVSQRANRYRNVRWQPTPTYDGLQANSIFNPNRQIIIPDRRPSRNGGQL